LFVAAWGYFLYQGIVDPLGGINSLWPIFGVANQLLAVIAFALGTTVLLKMGRVRYIWVTGGPLVVLLVVTLTAGWMKIFSANPKLGFLSAAEACRRQIAGGGTAAQLEAWRQQVFNNQVNAVVVAVFLVLVLLVVAACVRVWWRLLAGRRVAALAETPYVVAATGG
jgi:carbon starvation protein